MSSQSCAEWYISYEEADMAQGGCVRFFAFNNLISKVYGAFTPIDFCPIFETISVVSFTVYMYI